MNIIPEHEFLQKYIDCRIKAIDIFRRAGKAMVFLTEDYDLASWTGCKNRYQCYYQLNENNLSDTEQTLRQSINWKEEYARYWACVRHLEYKKLTHGITNKRLAEIFGKSVAQVTAYSFKRSPIPDKILAQAILLDQAIRQVQHDDPRVQQVPQIEKIIDGKLYSTQTAQLLKVVVRNPMSAEKFEAETLYRTKTGNFFFAALGGSESQFADHNQTGQILLPMSIEEAKAWMQKHATAQEYISIFGPPPEA